MGMVNGEKLLKGIPLAVPDVVAELRFPAIRDLAERLHFCPADGRIWLDDRRMVLIHTEAFGSLRQELIEALGIEQARGLLTRMGYLSGSRDAGLANKVRPQVSSFDAFSVGPQLHALEGIVLVEPVRVEIDSAQGRYYGEFLWKDSSEDESHVSIYGIGSEPVCWMQIGYACGYTSAFMGKRILYREIECRSMGNTHCRIVGKPVEEWDNPEEDLKYFEARRLKDRSTIFLSGGGSSSDELQRSKTQPSAKATSQPDMHQLVGISAGFNAVMHKVQRVACTRATVLLLGESGVGKSRFGRTLHCASPRARGPFVEVNCAAIPESLIEAELFGVEQGSYTGATHSRPGRFEVADGGTMLLDEIGTLSLTTQGKLLRAVQSGEIERLGSSKTKKVDVRIVTATNVDLRAEVKQGRFREDLFYRLNVFPIVVPPLRERKDDIPVLLEYFLKQFTSQHGRHVTGFTNQALRTLLNYNWPGNIREMENVLERGVILAQEGGAVDVCHLFSLDESMDGRDYYSLSDLGSLAPESAHVETNAQDPDAKPLDVANIERIQEWARHIVQSNTASLVDVEKALVKAAVEQAGGNISKGASLLGISRAQLDYRVKKLAD